MPDRSPRRLVVMGAGGRDFHVFAMLFRDDPGVCVVAFTAAQIPGIDDRVFPASLAGPHYPHGIPIVPEAELGSLIRAERVDEVVLAYSDLSHEDVMHAASRVLAAGADFRLAGPASTMLTSHRPVVAVCAVRTGCGKSQTSRAVARLLRDAGLRVALIRHPMPYGDLEAMRVQRFATLADIDAAEPSVEEREEYEAPIEMGLVVFAGVDYAAVLRAAEAECDVIVWDGGNNDFPFVRPDLMITVLDPLRPGHELAYHPGETCLRMADVVVVNKVDAARPDDVAAVITSAKQLAPGAAVVLAESPVRLDNAAALRGQRVLVVEDGPTLTHGGMQFGAGTVAARAAGATIVDPRPCAVGSVAQAFQTYPSLGAVLPAMGYDHSQLDDLAATARALPVDAVVCGTPMDLDRLTDLGHPVHRARYALREVEPGRLQAALQPVLRRCTAQDDVG
jgi:predicted GTPase